MTLPLLVTKDMWQEFDDAWAELRSSGGPIDEQRRADFYNDTGAVA